MGMLGVWVSVYGYFGWVWVSVYGCFEEFG